MSNILLIEDIEECQILVKRAFTNTSIHVHVVKTVKEALDAISDNAAIKYDLIILDLKLPDGEGLSVLEKLKTGSTQQIPVFLLTSDNELESKVTAFNLGADDYLVKPVSAIELRARVEMRLKKTQAIQSGADLIRKGSLVLDTSLMRASIMEGNDAKILPLTGKEFKILALLLKNEGKVYSRSELVKSVWGDTVHILERTVDSHIFGLRKKLESYSNLVECIPQVGYRFSSERMSQKDSQL